MTNTQLAVYAEQLRVPFRVSLFDGGQTIRLGRPESSFTYEWGDDWELYTARVNSFLNNLPWPSDDDPRAEHEGTYA